MNEIVLQLVSDIDKDYYFDTHTIINRLIKEHHDDYLKGFAGYTSTELYHAAIGKIISTFNDKLVIRIGDSYSENVKGQYSPAACWKRI